MNLTVALAQQVAHDRQHEISEQAERWRRYRESVPRSSRHPRGRHNVKV